MIVLVQYTFFRIHYSICWISLFLTQTVTHHLPKKGLYFRLDLLCSYLYTLITYIHYTLYTIHLHLHYTLIHYTYIHLLPRTGTQSLDYMCSSQLNLKAAHVIPHDINTIENFINDKDSFILRSLYDYDYISDAPMFYPCIIEKIPTNKVDQ